MKRLNRILIIFILAPLIGIPTGYAIALLLDHLSESIPSVSMVFWVLAGLTLVLIGGIINLWFEKLWIWLRYRKKKANITVDIDGTPISIDNLTQEEADNLAERFKSLHPKISIKEHQ